MADFGDQVIDATLALEGGYSNSPNDAGRETNWGITVAVARQNGYSGPMISMTRDQAKVIYRAIYYARPGIYLIAPISEKIAAKVYDCGVNMGTGTAVMFLQRALNVLTDGASLAVDGAIGPATAARLADFLHRRPIGEGTDVILRALNGLQAAHYIEIAEARAADRSFIYGWLRARIT